MNRFAGFDSTGERLAGILETAEEQRECLARGDLEAFEALQARRQQLLEGIQSLDKRDEGARATLSRILRLDRDMGSLLLVELADTKEKMKTVTSLRKLLRSRLPVGRHPPRHLSRRA